MNIIKKNILLILIVTVLIVSSIFNIYQYKSSLAIKSDYGQRIRTIEEFSLAILPRIVLTEIVDNDIIDEIVLANVIGQIDITKDLEYFAVARFSPIKVFLDNTEDDLKKLYKLINENEGEIDVLIKEIADNQKKSLKIYEEIKKFQEEYMGQMNDDGAYDKWDLLWYRNSQGKSDELIKIIENGFR
ncbi:MAG: hypothetical protein U9N10_11025 [Bacillota bacterium]|nr:hypothetical protein [Bacillota bacterium]